MFSATFIFAKKQYDDEFYALDAVIADVAKSIPGYLGEENWESAATGLVSNVYYWDCLASLQLLMQHPSHLAAKQNQAKWLDGYRVEISEILRTYGDARLPNTLKSNATGV
jgi:heme-degrading monooxygenase HmoA